MTQLEKIIQDVLAELVRATQGNAPMHSAHEGYAVILEELDELKAHVWSNPKRRDHAAMREEAVQVAAMALRFIFDVCDTEKPAASPPRPAQAEVGHRNVVVSWKPDGQGIIFKIDGVGIGRYTPALDEQGSAEFLAGEWFRGWGAGMKGEPVPGSMGPGACFAGHRAAEKYREVVSRHEPQPVPLTRWYPAPSPRLLNFYVGEGEPEESALVGTLPRNHLIPDYVLADRWRDGWLAAFSGKPALSDWPRESKAGYDAGWQYIAAREKRPSPTLPPKPVLAEVHTFRDGPATVIRFRLAEPGSLPEVVDSLTLYDSGEMRTGGVLHGGTLPLNTRKVVERWLEGWESFFTGEGAPEPLKGAIFTAGYEAGENYANRLASIQPT